MDEGVDQRLAGLKELHRLSLLSGADSNELYRQYLEVGCRLLGLSVGQHIDWAAPGGKVLKLTLLAVEYQPEAAGEYSRA